LTERGYEAPFQKGLTIFFKKRPSIFDMAAGLKREGSFAARRTVGSHGSFEPERPYTVHLTSDQVVWCLKCSQLSALTSLYRLKISQVASHICIIHRSSTSVRPSTCLTLMGAARLTSMSSGRASVLSERSGTDKIIWGAQTKIMNQISLDYYMMITIAVCCRRRVLAVSSQLLRLHEM
jgi:hypothetical protein